MSLGKCAARVNVGQVLLSMVDGELRRSCSAPSLAAAVLRLWHRSVGAASVNCYTALPALGSLNVKLKIQSLSELTACLL